MVPEKYDQRALDCKEDQSTSIGDGRHLVAADGRYEFLPKEFSLKEFSPYGIFAERNFRRTVIWPNGNFA